MTSLIIVIWNRWCISLTKVIHVRYLLQVLEEYQKTFGESWRTTKTDVTQPWQYLDDALTKYQVWFVWTHTPHMWCFYLGAETKYLEEKNMKLCCLSEHADSRTLFIPYISLAMLTQLCLENVAYPGIWFLYATKQLLYSYLLIRRLSKSGTLCVYCFSPLVEHIIVHWLNKAWFANDCFVFQFFSLQDPAEADKLLKIQRDLDETKIILVSKFMFVEPSGTWLTSFSNSKWSYFHVHHTRVHIC